jgi:DNA-binding XRE family transcriptional regulator
MHRKTVYVSSKLKHRDMWIASGLDIVSTWIHGEELPPEECSAMWDRYMAEVEACDAFVLYAEPDDHLKGCILEMGLAFGLGRPVIIVWAESIQALAVKIGTFAYHRSVTVVATMEEAIALLVPPDRLDMTGADIRSIRKSLGLTQQGMADAIGFNRKTINEMEGGKAPIERPTVLAILYLADNPDIARN